MKVRDLIANFIAPADATWDHANWDDLCGMADHYDYDYTKFSESVKEHHVVSWICSDTRVGLSLITLHGEVVAMAFKSARKSYKNVEYVSTETFERLKAFMLSCTPPDVSGKNYNVLDMDREVDFPASDEWRKIEITHLKEVE